MPAQAFLSSTHQSLWKVVSQKFVIPKNKDRAGVQTQLDWDLRNPKYIHRLSENARPYLYYVFQETKKYHMPAELALLPMIESDYIPYGRSRAGAVGLWQLMPDTASNFGIKMNTFYDGRRSTTVSTKAALRFLSYLYQEFNHNWLLALAAYNAGPGTVMEAIHYNQVRGKPTNFWALPLPKQTKEYIPKLLALATIIQHPHAYGVHLANVPDKAVTSTVVISKQMKLKTIAHLAQTSVHTVKKLNPALRRSITPPHQIVTLVLPAHSKPEFIKHLKVQKATHTQSTKQHEHVLVKHGDNFREHTYTVKRGDDLRKLAVAFDTTVYHIMQHNHLKTITLQVGQRLRLPNA